MTASADWVKEPKRPPSNNAGMNWVKRMINSIVMLVWKIVKRELRSVLCIRLRPWGSFARPHTAFAPPEGVGT